MPDQWEPTITAQREIALRPDAPVEIVFIPGLLCDQRLWAAQIESLHDVAHATVARLDAEDSIAGLAQSVLDQAPNTTFMLVGLSMGGYVALEILRQQPKRVLGLALISTSARPDTPEASQNRRASIERSTNDLPGVVEEMLPRLLHASHLGDTELTSTIAAMAKSVGPELFRLHQHAIMDRTDSRPSLHEITCPTLIVCGRDDKITPVEVHAEMAERILGSHLVVLEQCGHLAPLEQPGQVSLAMRSWLRETRNHALR